MKNLIVTLFFVVLTWNIGHAQCSGCTIMVSASSSATYTLTATDVLCITGGTFTGTIAAFPNGAKICVSGNAIFNPAGFTANPGGNLIVNSGSTATLPAITTAGGFRIDNYGTVTCSGALTLSGVTTINNYEGCTMTITPAFILATTGSSITNNGTLNFGASLTTNEATNVYNYGYINVATTFTNSTNFLNYGKLTVTGDITFQKKVTSVEPIFKNYCTVITDGSITNNSTKTQNFGYIFVNAAGKTFTNVASAVYYQNANGITIGTNFSNSGSVTGQGNYYFTGGTTNASGATFGADALGINFYDTTPTGSQIMDTQTVLPNASVTKTAITPPQRSDMSSACNIAGTKAPVAVNDFFTTYQNQAVSGNILVNDIDPNNNILQLNTSLIGTAQHGTPVIQSNGDFTYTPTSGYYGTDLFVYQVCSTSSPQKCSVGSVEITINKQAVVTPACDASIPITTTLTTQPNTYFSISGSVSAPAGSTSITVGALNSLGASTVITAGDKLLVIQMQGADINYTNTDAYGDGIAGGFANGVLYNSNFTAGYYEYVVAANDFTSTTGGTINLASPLINSYVNADADATHGQRRFQVIRVPQYTDLTLGANLTVPAWDGNSGGVLVLNVSGTMNFNGYKIDGKGKGFRGGGGRKLGGSGGQNTDYIALVSANVDGSKGEGIVGTPRYINNAGVLKDNSVEGYPSGCYAMGAPGNAGGGGTDGTANASNTQNSGGGGGANGGAGGKGGNAWSSSLPSGGEPGAPFYPASPLRLILGGGGGAGSTNDGTPDATGFQSSGAAGGAIVIMYANSVSSNAGTIDVSGADGWSTVHQDACGGGGAGGSVLLIANSSISPITVLAKGGNGGSNDYGQPHGPGGGGGGGVIFTSSSINASSSVAGGACGMTGGAIGSGITVFGSVKGDDGVVKTTIKEQELAPGSTGCYNYIVAGNDNNITNKNVAVSGDVMKNDFDVEGDAISFAGFYDIATATYKTSGSITLQGIDLTGATVANAGTLAINSSGTYTFTPTAGFTGYVNVDYKAQDNNKHQAYSTARLTIHVTPICNTPNDIIPLNDHVVTYMNIAASGNVTTNDIDPQSDALSFAGFQNPSNSSQYLTGGTLKIDGTDRFGDSFSYAGDFSINSNGSYTFTPVAHFAGSVIMNYKVCDNNTSPICKVANLKIDVEPLPSGVTNHIPYNGDNGAFTAINQTLNGSALLSNSGDADSGDVLSITTTPVVAPAHGSVTLNANGTYIYTPTSGYSGPDYFIFEVKDNKSTPAKSNGLVYINVLKRVPVISSQPTDKNICPTGTVSFSITATGTNISYQWRKNGTNLSNGGTISGATSLSLTITGVSSGDAGSYDCVVTGDCSSVTSSPATLTVGGAPVSISSQPVDQTVCTGSNASFSASGIGAGLTYQWQLSTNGGSSWSDLSNGGVYSGVTAATMNITGAPLANDGYKYRCVISSTCAAPATTNPATLYVNTLVITFTNHPSNSTICSESNTSFTVAAVGSSLSYQWQVSTDNGGTWNNVNAGTNYSNETTAMLLVTNASTAMNGYRYRCIVSSACASPGTSNAGILTINARPAITNTVDGVRCGTGSITLQATASAGTLNWYSSYTGGASLGTGATFNTPSVSANTYYYVDATNGSCVSLNRSAVLAEISSSAPVITSSPSAVTTCENGDASFTVIHTGKASAYQWQVSSNGGSTWTDLNNTGTISGVKTTTLSLSTIAYTTSGYQYRCVITDVCGIDQTTSAAALTVNKQPAVVFNPANTTVCSGNAVSFSVIASGGGLNYQWLENGVNLTNTGVYSGVTTSSLAISSSTGLSSNTYSVRISNSCGSSVTSNTAAISFSATNVSITSQPLATTVCSGSSAQFLITAAGAVSSYQWQENGVNLNEVGVYSGVKTPTLVISNSSSPTNLNGKLYQCVVSSTCKTGATSSAVKLTVTAAPSITGNTPGASCGAGTVSLAATPSAGTLNWYVASVGGPSLGTGSPFTTPSISTSTNFYVDATSGGCTTASRTAILATINDLPVIVDQPSNSTICETTNTSFSANATGAGLSYQWQVNTGSGWNNVTDGSVYSGATSTTLNITGATVGMNNYQYQVIVSGSCSPAVTSNAVRLVVNANPSISTQPSAVSACPGSNASFSVVATGTAVNYQWQENRGAGWNNISDGGVYSGTTSASLTITGATSAMNSFQYRVVLDGACGSIINSNAATLTVYTLPTITGTTSANRCGTGTVSLSATASSGTVNWYDAATGGNLAGTGSPFTTVSLSSTTTYYVEALINGCPSASRTAVIATINPLPAIGLTVGGSGAICSGTGTNITVASSVSGTSYQLRDASNTNVGTAVAGNGSSINLPTGNLTSNTTFNVL
ncbi:MAG: Ig-like domain-containing protein, partial [Bacteroidota bacterium]|nr:Ig-like domain-containing protein [Bacteroidota bacterium]